MNAGPSLRLDGVTVRLGATSVLADVSWSVGPDERWVVLGANGAGKTTLLRVAALYLHPTSGRVEVLGETLGRTDVRGLRRRIAFASPALAGALDPRVTALEAVMTAKHAALAPWWHRYDDGDRERARTLLARFGCEERAEHEFPTLSAGERQRVLLARTLMHAPGLVLLDEPTAGLDVGGRETLVGDLAALAGDSASPPIVLVTHHLEEIPPGFTHALVLEGGRISAAGPIQDTLTDSTLSHAFGLPLRVEHHTNRWTARLG